MFKKFTPDSMSGQSRVKASVARAIRSQLVEQYPMMEGVFEELIPKKAPVMVAKCQHHVSLVVCGGEVLFFQERNGPFFPTLRLLHQYPQMLPTVQVDKGAIKHIFKGANIMCPGLTSPGARMETPLEAETIVAVHAEGKELPLCIGMTKMSTDEIKKVNAGIGVELCHYLGDGLWKLHPFE
eukprot:TRINITY_DN15870_c0_g1_i1.p1 TRINITY_DN15870_c0_g1~~TRINITY_DN15870_c0_g1_i1.p1  ORF type:complete len:192 (+),score=56.04 TRINITY_DN15870_c0_g1_i1:32-577(+)